MRDKPVYEINGAEFSTLEEFARHFSDVVLAGYQWNGNLDAFNDLLRGGFGTPDGGFVLRWRCSTVSRERLGSTVFDVLVDIIRDHGEGGVESEDGVELELL